MPKLIAAFPLGLVCFPGEKQNLHIFEPRYRQLIKDCEKDKITFSLVPFVNGMAYHLATEVTLDNISRKYPDGKYDITIEGISLFEVKRLLPKYPGKLYPGVKVSPSIWDDSADYKKSELIVNLLRELYELLNITNSVIPEANDFQVSKIVHKIGLSMDQELKLLSISHEKNRQDFVINHLNQFIPEVLKMKDLQIKAALNGHFKEIDPLNF